MHNKSIQEKSIYRFQPVESRLSPWLTPLAYFLGRRMVVPNFFGKITITGQGYIPTEGPVILAPTHRSRWDALLLPYATGRHVSGRDLRFMVTADEVKGVQGWFIRRLGGFAVNVHRPSIATLRHGVDLLRQGEMIVIFPEGGIFRGEEVRSLKPGLARMALQAEASSLDLGVSIIPVSLHYNQSCPAWGTDVEIVIGKPLKVARYKAGCTKDNARQLTQDLHQALSGLNATREPMPLMAASA
ncbi:MAG: lysophospholipid acyltransferase family protein [Cyanobacteria bacterium J06639_16]